MSTQANAKKYWNKHKLAWKKTPALYATIYHFLTNLVNPFILAELGVESSSLQWTEFEREPRPEFLKSCLLLVLENIPEAYM